MGGRQLLQLLIATTCPTMDTHRLAVNIRSFAGWLLVTFAAAALGAWASRGAPAFYAQLNKPEWAPPAGVFGPVWSALYLLMAIAAWLVWRVRGFAAAPRTLALYLVQLAANALWSWLFFAWHLGAAAFAEVLVLWALIVATTIAFWKARRGAGLLLLPYLAWVTFASALTFACWQRNPQLLG
jgi:tryptophan-rich sensory protein